MAIKRDPEDSHHLDVDRDSPHPLPLRHSPCRDPDRATERRWRPKRLLGRVLGRIVVRRVKRPLSWSPRRDSNP